MNNYIKALYLIYLTNFGVKKLLNMTWEYNLTDKQYQDVVERMGKKWNNDKTTINQLAAIREAYGSQYKA